MNFFKMRKKFFDKVVVVWKKFYMCDCVGESFVLHESLIVLVRMSLYWEFGCTLDEVDQK